MSIRRRTKVDPFVKTVFEKEILRKIRKMRQKPAHAIDENIFDQQYFKDQRELIINAYTAIRTLRMMLENHPAVKAADIEIPDWLREGKIWTY